MVLNRKYEVDGKETTLRDFLNNTIYKVRPMKISSNEGRAVIDLELDESKTINV